jgi:hypothetical protein
MLNNPNLRIAVLLVTVYGVLGYGALLGLVSLTSVERTLEPGTRYAFCGLYFDCHLGVAIESARAEVAGTGAGHRYVVRLRFDSDAGAARLSVRNPTLRLTDASGRQYRPVSRLASVTLRPGEATRAEVVFETPGPLRSPRLLARQGPWIERVLETFLVGDVDSILHKRVYLAVGVPGSGS